MSHYVPSREVLAAKRNLLTACAIAMAKWFLHIQTINTLGFGSSGANPEPWRFSVVMGLGIAYLSWYYVDALKRDWSFWENEEGLSGRLMNNLAEEIAKMANDKKFDGGFSGPNYQITPATVTKEAMREKIREDLFPSNALNAKQRKYYQLLARWKPLEKEIELHLQESARRIRNVFRWLPIGAVSLAIFALLLDAMKCNF